MKIIIAPAKRMRNDIAYLQAETRPACLKQTRILLQVLKQYSPEALSSLLGCNPGLASIAYKQYQTMRLTSDLTPALLAYDGIQYTYMAPSVFEDAYFAYAQKHLRILSGFYGVLRPLDGVVSYRLELHDPLSTPQFQNLYAFWKDLPYRLLVKSDHDILDLASAQYSKLIRPYIQPNDRMVRCSFVEEEAGSYREKGVYVKMARGEMVRYLAEINAENFEAVKQFSRLGYTYHDQLSTPNNFVFVR